MATLKAGGHLSEVIGNRRVRSQIRPPDPRTAGSCTRDQILGPSFWSDWREGGLVSSSVTIEEGSEILERSTSDRYFEDLDVVIQRLIVKAPII